MRKICSTLILLSLVFLSIAAPAAAQAAIGLFLDGKPLASDVPPMLFNSRTLVPLRVVSEGLGATVKFTTSREPIIISKGSTRIELKVNQSSALVNDERVPLDVAPRLVNNRTMVPFRFIGESLGASVRWQSSPQAVYITSPIGQLSSAEVRQSTGRPTSLFFRSTRPIVVDSEQRNANQYSFLLNNVEARAERNSLTQGDILEFAVEPTQDGKAWVHLVLGEKADYLHPQANITADGLGLTISWPLQLGATSFVRSGGIEYLDFGAPSFIQPQVTDTTI